jgi:hypothetical protein
MQLEQYKEHAAISVAIQRWLYISIYTRQLFTSFKCKWFDKFDVSYGAMTQYQISAKYASAPVMPPRCNVKTETCPCFHLRWLHAINYRLQACTGNSD